jgi:predicted alpha/beta superfamily hydrolase
MTRTLRALALSLPLLVPAAPAPATAQAATRGTPYTVGERRTLRSATLGEPREVIVFTPASYGTGSARYPVLYVLDGAENAMIAATAARELASSARVPELIVVCVVNTQRGRDFTPALVKTRELPPGVEKAGGADRFLAFLGDELAPYIDAQYRTRPLRAVVGHSLGGLLAMHAIATRPALFRRVITVDPSLWWDAGAELGAVRAALARTPDARVRVAAVHGDSGELAQAFGSAGPNAHVVPVPLEGEAHEFLMYRGLYAGLIALFGDYYPAMRHDAGLANLAALEAQYAGLTRDFGYEVPIPMNTLLEVANREANQRRFARARAALDRAAQLYPGSPTPAQWRAQVAEFEAEARKLGQGEVVTRIERMALPPSVTASLVGTWSMRIDSPSPDFRPTTGTLTFALLGDTLMARPSVAGVAFDGGDYLEAWTPVEMRGDTLRWDRENSGGGREITAVVRGADGRWTGTSDIVDGHPLPAGFVVPEIRITLQRAPRG